MEDYAFTSWYNNRMRSCSTIVVSIRSMNAFALSNLAMADEIRLRNLSPRCIFSLYSSSLRKHSFKHGCCMEAAGTTAAAHDNRSRWLGPDFPQLQVLAPRCTNLVFGISAPVESKRLRYALCKRTLHHCQVAVRSLKESWLLFRARHNCFRELLSFKKPRYSFPLGLAFFSCRFVVNFLAFRTSSTPLSSLLPLPSAKRPTLFSFASSTLFLRL